MARLGFAGRSRIRRTSSLIFLTVGHQTQFDRLVRLMDRWCADRGYAEVFGQIGESRYLPRNFQSVRWLSPEDYTLRLATSSAVVAHAGTGTILSSIEMRKPLLVLPRLRRFHETRSDHQVGTARHFAQQGLLLAAFSDQEFLEMLDVLPRFSPEFGVQSQASESLMQRIREFIGDHHDRLA